MEMMYLIIKFYNASVVIPEKYPKEQCEVIAQENRKLDAYCIPAPKYNIGITCGIGSPCTITGPNSKMSNPPVGMSNPPSYIDNMPKYLNDPVGLEKK